MAFDIKRYHEDNKDFFGGAPMEDVAKDAFTRFGYDKKFPSFEDWKKQSGIQPAIEEDTYQEQAEIARQKDPGIAGELVRSLGRGITQTLPQMAGKGLQWIDPDGGFDATETMGKTLEAIGDKNVKRLPGLTKSQYAEDASNWNPQKWMASAGESLVQSAAPFAAGLAGTITGGPALGAAAGLATLGTLFYGGTAEDTYRRAKETGLGDDEAMQLANITGGVEAGGELIADLIPIKVFGIGLGKAAKGKIIKTLTSRQPAKEMMKNVLTTIAGEELTESGQQAIQTYAENKYGTSDQGVLDSVAEVWGPTLITSLVFGAGGATYNTAHRAQLRKALTNPNVDPDTRLQAIQEISRGASGIDPEVGKNFYDKAYDLWKQAKPITLDDDDFYGPPAAPQPPPIVPPASPTAGPIAGALHKIGIGTATSADITGATSPAFQESLRDMTGEVNRMAGAEQIQDRGGSRAYPSAPQGIASNAAMISGGGYDQLSNLRSQMSPEDRERLITPLMQQNAERMTNLESQISPEDEQAGQNRRKLIDENVTHREWLENDLLPAYFDILSQKEKNRAIQGQRDLALALGDKETAAEIDEDEQFRQWDIQSKNAAYEGGAGELTEPVPPSQRKKEDTAFENWRKKSEQKLYVNLDEINRLKAEKEAALTESERAEKERMIQVERDKATDLITNSRGEFLDFVRNMRKGYGTAESADIAGALSPGFQSDLRGMTGEVGKMTAAEAIQGRGGSRGPTEFKGVGKVPAADEAVVDAGIPDEIVGGAGTAEIKTPIEPEAAPETGKGQFTDYKSAVDWIGAKGKEYGGRNKFLASDEYKAAHPEIRRLYDEKKAEYDAGQKLKSADAIAAMEETGTAFGDVVEYDVVGMGMSVETYRGTIKAGVGKRPIVKLDQPTSDGRRTVFWHKGWKNVAAEGEAVKEPGAEPVKKRFEIGDMVVPKEGSGIKNSGPVRIRHIQDAGGKRRIQVSDSGNIHWNEDDFDLYVEPPADTETDIDVTAERTRGADQSYGDYKGFVSSNKPGVGGRLSVHGYGATAEEATANARAEFDRQLAERKNKRIVGGATAGGSEGKADIDEKGVPDHLDADAKSIEDILEDVEFETVLELRKLTELTTNRFDAAFKKLIKDRRIQGEEHGHPAQAEPGKIVTGDDGRVYAAGSRIKKETKAPKAEPEEIIEQPIEDIMGDIQGTDTADIESMLADIVPETKQPGPEPPTVGRPEIVGGASGGKGRTTGKPKEIKTAGSILGEAVSAGVEGIDEALKGVFELFGGSSLRSFPGGIDEDTYAKAKPHFQAALDGFVKAGKGLKEYLQFMVNNFGAAIKPYLMRFIRELKGEKTETDTVTEPETDTETVIDEEGFETETETETDIVGGAGTGKKEKGTRKKKQEDVGEKMRGKISAKDHRTRVAKLTADLTDDLSGMSSDAVFRMIIAKTAKSSIFTIDSIDGATPGVRRVLEQIRSQFMGFIDAHASMHSYRGGQSNSKKLKQAVEETPNAVANRAAEYIATMEVMSDALNGHSTVEAVRDAFIEIISEIDEKVSWGRKFNDFSGKLNNYLLSNSLTLSSKYGFNGNEKNSWFDSFIETQNDETKNLPIRRKRIRLEDLNMVGTRRDGKDIEAQRLLDDFGLRGVEFGEWVDSVHGQLSVNYAFDALHDLAETIGAPAMGISLNVDRLGLAFGSRGSTYSKAAAFFEPGYKVINLTKTSGDGTLSHEWAHALDYMGDLIYAHSNATDDIKAALNKTYDISELAKDVEMILRGGYAMGKKNLKAADRINAAKDLLKNWVHRYEKDTTFYNNAVGLDGGTPGKYWSKSEEMFARAFEGYVSDNLKEANPYLVHSEFVSPGGVESMFNRRHGAYPVAEERERFNGIFKHFLDGIQWSEDGIPSMKADYVPILKNERDILKQTIKDLEARLQEIFDSLYAGEQSEDGLYWYAYTVTQRGVRMQPDGHMAFDDGYTHENTENTGKGAIGYGNKLSTADIVDYDLTPITYTKTDQAVYLEVADGTGEGTTGTTGTDSEEALGGISAEDGETPEGDGDIRTGVVGGSGIGGSGGGGHGISAGNSVRSGVGDSDESVDLFTDGEGGTDTTGQPVSLAAAKTNFVLTSEDIPTKLTADQHFLNALSALRLLKQIESENRLATPEEQKVLVKMPGWGSLADAVEYYPKSAWETRAELLKAELTEAELSSARDATLTSYFTPIEALDFIYRASQRMGFMGGRMLEPANGLGHFFGAMPESMRPGSTLTGIEKDNFLVRFARQLYQNASILNSPYEKTNIPPAYFDFVATNVPFATVVPADAAYNPFKFKLHDYYIVKSINMLRPGGLAVMLTSSGTMDKHSTKAREEIARLADFLGAVRLPTSAFSGSQSTVTTDILFFRRKSPDAPKVEAIPWTQSVDREFPSTEKYYSPKIAVNEYFTAHPEMILGDLVVTQGRYGDKPELSVSGGISDLAGRLDEVLNKLPQNVYKDIGSGNEQDILDILPKPTDIKDGSYYLGDDGSVYQNDSGTPIKIEAFKRKDGTSNPKELRKIKVIKEFIGFRTIIRNILRAQAQKDDDASKEFQKQLLRKYNAFVKKYGFINKHENLVAFLRDPDAGQVMGIEKWNADHQTATKQAIFTENMIARAIAPTHVETAKDALTVSVNYKNRVDLAYMSRLTDFSQERVINELSGEIFNDPLSGWVLADDYLSGNIREKIAIAEQAAKADPKFANNVEALKAVIPEPLPFDKITVQMGSSWIGPELYHEFVNDLMDYPRGLKIGRSNEAGIWDIVFTGKMNWTTGKENQADMRRNKRNATSDYKATTRYGVSTHKDQANFYVLLNNLLNGMSPKLYSEDAQGDKRPDKPATDAAVAKMLEIKERFREWLWRDRDRREELSKYYNEKMNSTVLRRQDGAPLPLPGKVPDAIVTLAPHQNAAIRAYLREGSMYFAHDVGTGKTFTMIASVMESKRLGLAKRPIMVVLKKTLPQIQAQFYRLYPGASILVVRVPGNKELRIREMQKVATGNFDCIIMTIESFRKMKLSPEAETAFIEEERRRLVIALEAARQSDSAGSTRKIVKRIADKIAKLEARITELNEGTRDPVPSFDELGIDMIVADEAQAYKNLPIETVKGRVKGINSGDSDRAFDMFMKSQHVLQTYGRGIIFASGSAMSNSVAELYSISRFLQPAELRARGIESFDMWANTYGDIGSALEYAPEGGGYREIIKFRSFNNIPELMMMVNKNMDIVKFEDTGMKRPPIAGGKATSEMVPLDSLTEQLQEMIQARAVALRDHPRTAEFDGRPDFMFRIMNDGRNFAMDPRLYDPSLPDIPGTKTNRAVSVILGHYNRAHDATDFDSEKADKSYKEKKGVQLVFCDRGVPSPKRKFSVYEDMKQKLIKGGIPAKEIAFIHDYTKDADVMEVFGRVQSGDIRVIIGSTQKLGTGVNVQDRVVAMHNMDIGWTFEAYVQRVGRGVRHGNRIKEIYVYNYGMEKTVDAFMWDTVSGKGKIINLIMSRNPAIRSAADIVLDPDSMTADEMVAAFSNDPLIKEKKVLEDKISRLLNLRGSFERQRADNQRQAAMLPSKIEAKKAALVELNSVSKVLEPIDAMKFGNKEDLFILKKDGGKVNDAALKLSKNLRFVADAKKANTDGKSMLKVIGGFGVSKEETRTFMTTDDKGKEVEKSEKLVTFDPADVRIGVYYGALDSEPTLMVKVGQLYQHKSSVDGGVSLALTGLKKSVESYLEDANFEIEKMTREMGEITEDLKKTFTGEAELIQSEARIIQVNAELIEQQRRQQQEIRDRGTGGGAILDDTDIIEKVYTSGFYIKQKDGAYVSVADAEAIFIVPFADTIIHTDNEGDWVISERATGISISFNGKDRDAAIEKTKRLLLDMGESKYKKIVKEAIEDSGTVPGYQEDQAVIEDDEIDWSDDIDFRDMWHGTPHFWEAEKGYPYGRPRLDMIFSKETVGEGAWAYGAGFYMGGNKEIAEYYLREDPQAMAKAQISDDGLVDIIDGIFGHDFRSLMDSLLESGNYDGDESKQAVRNAVKEDPGYYKDVMAEWLLENGYIGQEYEPSLYKLDLPDDVLPKLLEWDRPLSEQTDYVKEALDNISHRDLLNFSVQNEINNNYEIKFDDDENAYVLIDQNGEYMYGQGGGLLTFEREWRAREELEGIVEERIDRDGSHLTGQNLYDLIAAENGRGDIGASEYLAELGIPGNTHGGMSGGATGAKYVIWDQKVLNEIALLERNGQALEAIQESMAQGKNPKGLPVANVQKHLDPIIKKSGIPVVVFNGYDDPQVSYYKTALKTHEETKGRIVRGFHHKGKVYINVAAIDDLATAERVLAHELIGHAGLLEFMGEDANQFFDMLGQNKKYHAGVIATARRRGINTITRKGMRKAASEWFAEQVENGTIEPTLWTRFLKLFRDVLRKMKFTVEFSDADLAEIIRGAGKAAMTQKTRGGVNEFAQDVSYSLSKAKAAALNNPAFRKWFKGSAVKDTDGNPIAVYHGTKGDFNEFDISKAGVDEKGFFFTTSPGKAGRYGDKVMPVYLSISNPYRITQKEWSSGSDIGLDEAKKQGYDGYIVKGLEGRETFIVFEPTQIKSVFNRGTFDPKNPDIRYSSESRKAYDTAMFAHELVSQRLRRSMTDQEKLTRKLSYGVKNLNPDSVLTVATDMAKLIQKDGKNAILVPIPGHTGDTSSTTAIAKQIAKITGADVQDVLKRPAAMSQRENRVAGNKTMTPGAFRMSAPGLDANTFFDPAKKVYFVDNVISSGATIKAAQDAVGRGVGLVYAKSQNDEIKFSTSDPRYVAKERRYSEKRGTDGTFHDAWRVYDTKTAGWGSKNYSNKTAAESAAEKANGPDTEDINFSVADAEESSLFSGKNPTFLDKLKGFLSPEHYEKVAEYLWDQDEAINRVQKEIGPQAETRDYALSKGLMGKKITDEIKQFDEKRLKPLLKDMADSKVKTQAIHELLHADHAPERNLQMKRINARRYIDAVLNQMTEAEAKPYRDRIIDISDDAMMNSLMNGDISELNERRDGYVALMDELTQEIIDTQDGVAKDLDTKQAELDNRTFSAGESRSWHQDRIDNARDRLERRIKTAVQWDDVKDRLSGMTKDESNRIKAKYRGNADMRRIADTIRKINADALDMLHEVGEVSDEEFFAMTSAYKLHVPLMREDYPEGKGSTGNAGYGPLAKPYKLAYGSTRGVENIFAHVIDRHQSAISRAHKAETGRILYEMVKENPDENRWEITKLPKKPRHDDEGNLRMYPDTSGDPGADAVYVKVDGKKYLIKVYHGNKPMMRWMAAVKREVTDLGPITQASRKIVRLLANLNTSLSPEFMLTNFMRDLPVAMIHLETIGGAEGAQKAVIKGVKAAIKGIYASERGDNSSEWAAWYRDYAKQGAKIGWMQSYDTVEQLAKNLEKELAFQEGRYPKREKLRKLGQWIDAMNTSVENGVRLSAYRVMVEGGMTKAKAAQAAAGLTVDFSKHGTAGPVMNSFFMFANAGIQGNVRMIKAVATNRKVQKIAAGIVGFGALANVLGVMIGGDDDDGESYYDKLKKTNPDLFERNMVFMIPGSGGKHFKIPMPYGYNVFFVLGSELAGAARGQSPIDGMGRIGSALMGTLNPLSSATLLQTIMPTIGDPIAQIFENKSWHGGALMPEKNPFGIPTPDSERYFKSVNPVAKYFAKGLNWVTGGDKYDSGVIDVSPETVEMIFETFTGSAGRLAKDALSIPLALTSEDGLTMNKIPFVRKMIGAKTTWADDQIYRENNIEVDVFVKRFKEADGAEKAEMRKDPLYKMVAMHKMIESQLLKLNKSLKVAEKAGNNVHARQIKERMTTAKKAYNRRYNEID